MPGVKSIEWNESNKAKCFDAIMFHGTVKVSNEGAEAVAAALGGGCTSAAVKSLISGLGKRHFLKAHPDAVPAAGAGEGVSGKGTGAKKNAKTAGKSGATDSDGANAESNGSKAGSEEKITTGTTGPNGSDGTPTATNTEAAGITTGDGATVDGDAATTNSAKATKAKKAVKPKNKTTKDAKDGEAGEAGTAPIKEKTPRKPRAKKVKTEENADGTTTTTTDGAKTKANMNKKAVGAKKTIAVRVEIPDGDHIEHGGPATPVKQQAGPLVTPPGAPTKASLKRDHDEMADGDDTEDETMVAGLVIAGKDNNGLEATSRDVA